MQQRQQGETSAKVSRRALLRPAAGRRGAETDNHAVAIGSSCLAHRGVSCRSCEDVCEPRALRFRPELGGVFKPEIDLAACTNCGECGLICPVNAIKLAGRAGA